ncbi:MAG: 50S ribosomal protein L1 [Alphaproteobacteria bacterium]
MMTYGKRLRKTYETVDRTKSYTLEEAVKLLKGAAKTKFDETIDVAINLNVDTKKADQQVRGVIQLPHGLGKTVRVAVFVKPERVEEAKKAGADVVGSEDLVEEVLKGRSDFDKCIATPDMMVQVGKLGKALGPRGLMPNPKLGTVTADIQKAIHAVKAGQVEYRAEKSGIVQAGVGKLSFSEQAIFENIKALYDAIIRAKPTGAKGVFVKKFSISSTMGPGIKIDTTNLKA